MDSVSHAPIISEEMVKFMGKEVPRKSVEKALYSATAFLVIFNTLTIPFALPKLRVFLGAPYLPSNTRSFQAVLDHIQPNIVGRQKSPRLVDIGSGDGRLVREAAKRGFSALGIEMNPWLVGISRIRNWKSPMSQKILLGNAWNQLDRVAEFDPDIITFYGRPGQGLMTKFGDFAEQVSDQTGKNILIVSNKFHIPNWHLRQIAQVDDFIVYKLHSNKV